jgi:CDP-glycerol glycerophosphotransferase (TagB/SpsB family)
MRGVKPYFCVAKKSPDFVRMKKIGPTIPFGGRRFKLLQLFGATFVSSQADDAVINTLGKFDYFRDVIFDRKFVFLQHGVIQNDLSDWLKKENKNISLFITTTLPEYRSILKDGYGYTEKEVVLTGLPRYDLLYEQDQKVIAVIPTWRKFLVATVRKDTEKEYDESVTDSAYFRFYAGLLSDHRLLAAAEKAGYRICFKLHPSASAIGKKIRGDKRVEIIGKNRSYREIIAKSSLLVTDYSSVAFDFAYLKKPVVYCQFDEQDFFSGEHVVNLKRGYFDYRLHGFGEVVTNLEETIELLLSYLEHDCRIKEEYRTRVAHTFRYYDDRNCERVTEKILELTRGR